MPDIPWSIVGAIITAIFSTGVTWGVMTMRQKTQEMLGKTAERRVDETISDLKEAVKDLKTLTTELHVIKITSTRNERDIDEHEKRIAALEISLAKLHRTT